jgi:hypothetical protein
MDFVIPAKAGIREIVVVSKSPEARFRRHDELRPSLQRERVGVRVKNWVFRQRFLSSCPSFIPVMPRREGGNPLSKRPSTLDSVSIMANYKKRGIKDWIRVPALPFTPWCEIL